MIASIRDNHYYYQDAKSNDFSDQLHDELRVRSFEMILIRIIEVWSDPQDMLLKNCQTHCILKYRIMERLIRCYAYLKLRDNVFGESSIQL